MHRRNTARIESKCSHLLDLKKRWGAKLGEGNEYE